jgi:hypothetical protein
MECYIHNQRGTQKIITVSNHAPSSHDDRLAYSTILTVSHIEDFGKAGPEPRLNVLTVKLLLMMLRAPHVEAG